MKKLILVALVGFSLSPSFASAAHAKEDELLDEGAKAMDCQECVDKYGEEERHGACAQIGRAHV